MMFSRLLITAILLSVVVARGARAQDRNPVAERLANRITSAQVHRIYVPDFPDPSGSPSGAGAFFAATFSNLLSLKSNGFAVQNRMDAHTFLSQNNLTDYDLVNPANLARFSSQFNVDAILCVAVSSSDSTQSIRFILRDMNSKELLEESYDEPSKFTAGYFPAVLAPSGWPYYFGGLDGIIFPSCFYTPNPAYPDKMGKNFAPGVVVLSGVVTAQGRVDALRIIKSSDKKLEPLSLATLKTWRCKQAKDSGGNPVPVRVPFEIRFAIY